MVRELVEQLRDADRVSRQWSGNMRPRTDSERQQCKKVSVQEALASNPTHALGRRYL